MSAPESILPLSETATPGDEDAVAEAVRSAAQRGTPVYPLGGCTSLHYGVRPTRPGLGLSCAALDRVIDYPAHDLTITVEAGLTVAALAERLAGGRQWLPVDVPRADRATVGGVVAANPSGPRRYACGTMRDYVIGLRAVDGRGTAFSAGGRVVKNAAGYNVFRLMTGSLGTLGVMTQVTLMVKPMPEDSALVACDAADFDTAEKLLADLARTATLPTAIELATGPAWADAPGLAVSESAAARLVVGFEGTTAEVDWMLERLESEWRGSGGPAPTVIRGEACARAWGRLTEFPAEWPGDDGDGRAPLVAQISVLPRATVDFVRRLVESDPGGSVQAHAGDGVVVARAGREPAEAAAGWSERLRPAVAEADGSMVVLSCPADLPLGRQEVWGPAPDGLGVMQSIKDRFDPHGILNPGRFIYEE